MEKTFDPAGVEPRWRQRWEELEVGYAEAGSTRTAFTIALPPPNITGALHLGHAAGGSVQDTLARHHRMRGFEVEWCPGTDHAAIATNAIIERQLAEEGLTKEGIGREAFYARVDSWYAEYGGRIYDQMRRLGFTCDWTRARFTLDDAYVRAIRVVFRALYAEGLIYRGPRIVNWCPHCRSAISDEEIDWQEHADSLVRIRYPVDDGSYVTVATVRPETMVGDTAVAVSPDDQRYTHLVGRSAVLPITDRAVPIIADEAVRPDFGTGALKVTPGHDPLDYEIGRRHALPSITVIAADGTMDVPQLPQFHGMPAEQARVAVTDVLRRIGALVGEEPYVHEVGHCDRCHHVLEPLISSQWWVRMESLAEPAIAAVESGDIRFHPARYREIYLSWMANIRDWCISRQIWLGHAIPVSTCRNGHQFAWVEEPELCPECGSPDLAADPDVLDTWFSSALWPFAIFGWPEDTLDLGRFYPTDVLVTAREIIFLWVARMIMTGLKFAGAKPFGDVVITSTIQAGDGSRMSKSRGNVVDPLEMIERYGADAVRAWAGAVGTSGQDMRFDEKRIESYQRFANKLWSVTRLLVGRLGEGAEVIAPPPGVDFDELEVEDRWLLARIADTVRGCDTAIAAYRFHDAMDRLYDVVWRTFCDRYVEMIKPRLGKNVPERSRAAAGWTSVTALDILLRLLHPFMPFVTEECAQHLPNPAASLQQRAWPEVNQDWLDPGLAGQHAVVDAVLDVGQQARSLRQERGLSAASSRRHPMVVRAARSEVGPAVVERLLSAIALLDPVEVPPAATEPATLISGGLEIDVYLDGAGPGDETRLRRQLLELDAKVERLSSQLGNAAFVERARPEVVAATRLRLSEALEQRESVRRLTGRRSP